VKEFGLICRTNNAGRVSDILFELITNYIFMRGESEYDAAGTGTVKRANPDPANDE